MKRGILTEEIRKKSKRLLGFEIGTLDLRLFPYIIDRVMNEGYIEHEKVNEEEFNSLLEYEINGYLKLKDDEKNDNRVNITVTKEFWDIMCEIVYLGYVAAFCTNVKIQN